MIRRRALLGGLGLAVAAGAGVGGVLTDVLPGAPGVRRALGWTGPAGTVPAVAPASVEIRRLSSAARGATSTPSRCCPDAHPPARHGSKATLLPGSGVKVALLQRDGRGRYFSTRSTCATCDHGSSRT